MSLPNARGEEQTVVVSRERFDGAIKTILERTGVACRRAFKDAGLRPEELDGVILVGGSTRVPAVRTYVRSVFRRDPLADIDPDQVVALGAAVQADLLAGDGPRDEVLLLDVLPLSLGIEVGGGVVTRSSRATSPSPPARASYTTREENQTGFVIHVVQGERELADCRSLARHQGHHPWRRLSSSGVPRGRRQAAGARQELVTGIQQSVSVKPSYGLDDGQSGRCSWTRFTRGGSPAPPRRREPHGRAPHPTATAKAVEADASTRAGRREAIDAAITLAEAARGNALVGRSAAASRSRRAGCAAPSRAIEGRKLDDVERRVGVAPAGRPEENRTWPR